MPQTQADPWKVVKSAPLPAGDPWAVVANEPAPEKSWIETATGLLNTIPGMPHPEDLKQLAQWLPAAGAAAGGVIGGAGGTVAGFGVGGVPGAIGGAAVGGAGGEAARQLITRATGGPAPATAGEAAKDIGIQAAVQGGVQAVGGVAAPVIARMGTALMQSAVKPGIKGTVKALMRGAESPIVRTMLKEGVNVSPGGIAKLNKIINASNDEIKTAVASLKGWIYPEAVAARTDDVALKFANQVNPRADVAAVKDSAAEFLQTRSSGGQFPAKPMTVAEAQSLKTGTYRALSEKAYGEVKTPAIEAQKALARGLKEDIEAEAKKAGIDIAKPNLREGAALSAREEVAKRVAAAGNRDPAGLAWLAHNPTTGLLFIMERSPAVKSMLARGLYQSAARVAHVPENVLRTMIAAISTSREDEQ